MKYYSEKLGKLFNTQEELEKAETERTDELADYQKSLDNVHELRTKYLDAKDTTADAYYKDLDLANKTFNNAVSKIEETYKTELTKAQKEYNSRVAEIKDNYKSLENDISEHEFKAWKEAFDEHNKKYSSDFYTKLFRSFFF